MGPATEGGSVGPPLWPSPPGALAQPKTFANLLSPDPRHPVALSKDHQPMAHGVGPPHSSGRGHRPVCREGAPPDHQESSGTTRLTLLSVSLLLCLCLVLSPATPSALTLTAHPPPWGPFSPPSHQRLSPYTTSSPPFSLLLRLPLCPPLSPQLSPSLSSRLYLCPPLSPHCLPLCPPVSTSVPHCPPHCLPISVPLALSCPPQLLPPTVLPQTETNCPLSLCPTPASA